MISFQTELPYDYYSLKFCKPKDGIHLDFNNTNLGTAILGLKIQNSPYKFRIMVSMYNLFLNYNNTSLIVIKVYEEKKSVCTQEESPVLDKYDIRVIKY